MNEFKLKPIQLIWVEKEIYNPDKFDVAGFMYHNLDERHKAAFKTYRADYRFELDEKQLFPNFKMWGFPSAYITLFKFTITPRYNSLGENFLDKEFPFMSVHSFLGKGNNNHIYLNTVEEGKEYAQNLLNEVLTQTLDKLQSK